MNPPSTLKRGYVVEAQTARRVLLVHASSWTEALHEALRQVGRPESARRLEYEATPGGSIDAYDPMLGERYIVSAADRGVEPPPPESWWTEPEPELTPVPALDRPANARSSMEKLMLGAAAASALLAGAATRLP